MMAETYHVLKGLLKKKYGLNATGVGDEGTSPAYFLTRLPHAHPVTRTVCVLQWRAGGFAPDLKSSEEGLMVLQEAIKTAGFEGTMKLAMDVAASELYRSADGKYDLNFKVQPNDGKQVITGKQLLDLYASFASKYPIVSIEVRARPGAAAKAATTARDALAPPHTRRTRSIRTTGRTGPTSPPSWARRCRSSATTCSSPTRSASCRARPRRRATRCC